MSATNQPNQSRLRVVQSAALSTLNSLVDNHFKCAICLDTFEGPNVIPECLHRFCDTCIKKSIQRCTECTCRARITSRRDLRKDQLLENIVSEKRCGCCLYCLVVYKQYLTIGHSRFPEYRCAYTNGTHTKKFCFLIAADVYKRLPYSEVLFVLQ